MGIRRSYWIKAAAINTHAGIGLDHGIVAWVRKKHRGINLFFFNEVRNSTTLSHKLGNRFTVFPVDWPGEGPEREASMYVAFHHRRFQLIATHTEDITFGGRHPRRVAGVILWDRRAHRLVVASVLHPAPLGRGIEKGGEHAVRVHKQQIGRMVAFHNTFAPKQDRIIHLAGGDTNELPGRDWDEPSSVRDQFARIGMAPVSVTGQDRQGPSRMMQIFTNQPSRRIIWSNTYETNVRGMDHEVAITGLKIPR